ncbi:MAG TPA: tRNA pseudouridine(54/55) synthase Pus10, partial [Candidatus Thermoplasmatota archaeon]|nr:tRNA pseudouridine(54/55) synthase Pus10 [Candidatus Thermoplasmatota archaeon]
IGAAGADPQREAARLQRSWPEVPEKDCPVCEGAFAEAGKWLEAALAAAKPYGFATFQVGTKFPGPGEGLEREVSAAMGREKVGETIRTEANRWLAAAIARATGTTTSPEGRPELVIEVDTRYWTARAEANAVFVKGRYNKLRRDIPQTHWPWRRCTGKGCWECGDTGVTYAESVEDAVGEPAEPAFGATGHSFHGAGREDIDALMLGTGRPFIVELANPRHRVADLADLAARINAESATSGVSVRDLRLAAPEEVAAIKEGEYGKEYLAHCLAQGPLARAQVEAVAGRLTGATLEQRTPDRVSHRRADLVRKRRLHKVTLEAMQEDPGPRFSLRVHAESGTYIKEMVSGDEGRTTPSFSELAGIPTKVEFLDVVAILDPPEA